MERTVRRVFLLLLALSCHPDPMTVWQMDKAVTDADTLAYEVVFCRVADQKMICDTMFVPRTAQRPAWMFPQDDTGFVRLAFRRLPGLDRRNNE